MKTEVILRAPDYSVENESIHIIIQNNIEWKLDAYLRKLHKSENPIRIELSLKRENDKQSQWKLVITVDAWVYRSERENFDNVHDLVNHLFGHIKEQMGK